MSIHRMIRRFSFLKTKPSAPSAAFVRIEPSKGWVSLKLYELWEYRELLYFFIWRDIKVRYKQTVLGGFWAVIQPFLIMVVFSLFFGKLGKMPSDGIPYPIFIFSALVPWTFFASGLNQASSSLVGNSNLIKKVYFPRLAMPLASVLVGLIDFVLAFGMLTGIMFYFGIMPTWRVLWLPLILMVALAASLGASLWLSALYAHFRDVRHIIPFLTQIWFFSTPIAYPSSLLPEPWRILFGLNPMVGVVDGFRWALLDTQTPPGLQFLLSVMIASILLVSGAFYFRRMERTFADII